jgi:hypothetical protein
MTGAAAAIVMLTAGATDDNRQGRAPGEASVAITAVEAGMRSAIADWLATEFGFPTVVELPRVVLAPAEELSAMRSEAVSPGALLTVAGAESLPDIVAFYNDAERTIYLPAGWSGATPAEVSILVHEMVHHIQNIAGLRYPCPEAREAPAYAAQAEWLARSGSDIAAAFGIDPMTLLVRTKCFH